MGKTSNNDYIWLAGILICAAAVRIYGLNAPLWYDEIVTVQTHLRLPWANMLTEFSMNHHYFFSLQAKAAILVFGEAPWVIRLPSLLFGVATVTVVWFLVRDIARPGLAHASALVVALSYHQVWFSQNARGYAELAFWCALGLLLFLRGMESRSLKTWLAFGLCLAAAGFTHLTGVTFFAALGLLFALTLVRGAWRHTLQPGDLGPPLIGAALGTVILMAFYNPLMASLLETMSAVSGTSAVDPMQEYQNPLWTVIEGVRTAVGQGGSLAALIALTALIVAAFGAAAAHRKSALFAPAIVMHIVLTLVILMALGMRIWPRFFFVDISLILVLLVLGTAEIATLVARVFGKPGWAPALRGLGISLMLLASLALLSRNYLAPKQNLAGAFALAEEIRQPGTKAYSILPGEAATYLDHFELDWGAIKTPQEYRAAMSGTDPVLLVVAFPGRMFRILPEFEAETKSDLKRVHRFKGTLGDGDVLVFTRGYP